MKIRLKRHRHCQNKNNYTGHPYEIFCFWSTSETSQVSSQLACLSRYDPIAIPRRCNNNQPDRRWKWMSDFYVTHLRNTRRSINAKEECRNYNPPSLTGFPSIRNEFLRTWNETDPSGFVFLPELLISKVSFTRSSTWKRWAKNSITAVCTWEALFFIWSREDYRISDVDAAQFIQTKLKVIKNVWKGKITIDNWDSICCFQTKLLTLTAPKGSSRLV